jgi:hypothetical protein
MYSCSVICAAAAACCDASWPSVMPAGDALREAARNKAGEKAAEGEEKLGEGRA